MLNPLAVRELVIRALQEDIGQGDVTTEACVPADKRCVAVMVAKEAGIICGHDVARLAFGLLDPTAAYTVLVPEGGKAEAGQEIARIAGGARAILMAERVALNFIQRMSGIATTTHRLAESLKFYKAKLVDTRKTTPGLRMLEKYAVRVGGGYNHRFGLADGVLIKDNHIALAGGIAQAVAAARRIASHTVRVEVEVETMEQLDEALAAGADVIMLDNMDPETLKACVQRCGGRVLLEASGGITEANLVDVAKSGVDLISMGALTHSARALDISLDIAEA
jgi:nicotinate-nucleotide pyrophosphorylase (carboxylating)